jgi:uncharacterized protein (DUF433 family)
MSNMGTDPIAKLTRGAYGVPEAARVAHLQPTRVRRWLGGYDFKSQKGERRHSDPVFPREHEGAKLALTFMDLIEVLYVSAILAHGVSMHTVRLVHREARDEFKVRHPFAIKRFETDGRTIFHRFVEAGAEHLVDRKRFQTAFTIVVDPLMKKVDYHDLTQDAARYWPLGRTRPVMIDPGRSFGEPVVTSGVPTRVLYNARRGGDPKERIARWYSVSVDEVVAAIEFEKSLSRSSARAA